MPTTEAAQHALTWFDLGPSVIGGVIGALAGGIPAWLIARRQSNETLRRDTDQRTRQEKALSFSVHVKLVTIVDGVLHDWIHIQRAMLILDDPETKHMEPWQVLEPIVGQAGEGDVRFTPEELALFMAAKERDFMMDLMLLAQRHGVGVAAMKEYCARREEIKARYPVPEAVDGAFFKATISREDWLKLQPYTAPLNGLAMQMYEQSGETVNMCRDISERIGPIVQRYFNDPTIGGLGFPTEEELGERIIGKEAKPA